jgi:hypothetical protein
MLTGRKPDLEAHRKATSLTFPDLVKALADILGFKLVAYIARRKDTRSVKNWIEGADSYGEVEKRIRLTYQIAAMLLGHDAKTVVQAWFIGMNPELGDRAPVDVLRKGDDADATAVLNAARAFLVGG